MADEKITDYTLSSTLSASTLFEYVDILDTTDPITGDATGSNKAISGANLSTALLASYTGTTSLVTLGTVATGVWSGTAIGVSKGGTGLTALPTANQVLGANSGATAYEGKTLTSGGVTVSHGTGTVTFDLTPVATLSLLANITGGSAAPIANTLTAVIDSAIPAATQGQILYRNATIWTPLATSTAGFVLKTGGASANPSWVAPRTPVWSANGAATAVTATTPTTGLAGFAGATGSLTIPANRLAVGSIIELWLEGTYTSAATLTTLTITIKIGSATIATGTSGAFTSAQTKQFRLDAARFQIQSIGSGTSATARGHAIFGAFQNATSGNAAINLTSAGTGDPSTAVGFDSTTTNLIDVLFSWGGATQSIQVTGGALWIDG